MKIAHNLPALNILRQINCHYDQIARSLERLSSGLRINRAADDPAGLAISEKMRAQIRGLRMAQRNVQDGISLIQTAEGSLNEIHAILQRMRELAVQAANDTYNMYDREAIQHEIEQLKQALNDIIGGTQFNTRPLLMGGTLRLQTGPNAGQSMELEMPSLSLKELNLDDLSVLTHEDANKAIEILQNAIDSVARARSRLGSYQNRLEHTMNFLTNYEMNLQAAESRIRDADIAREMMEYTKHQILLQVAYAMLAHANKQQQLILQLLTKTLDN